MKKLTKAIALAGVMTTGLTAATFTQAAEPEVGASVSIANMYLWRGQDLGQGAAAVSGDLNVSMGGAYGGIWMSSGDSALGQEYDLYLGYGGEVESFSYDISVWTYSYPGGEPSLEEDEGELVPATADSEGTTFDLSEVIVSLGYEGASFSYYYPVSSNPDDYAYMTLGYGMDAYSATVGMATDSADDSGYVHVDLSYAFNDNLSFTASKVVSDDAEDTDDEMDDDLKFVVSYSLPIE
ncbi:TorF family putative porin [Thalassolituus sp.]|uniref:TorF family putative porin n=1 Tax=Thalassolituus sp. TaxID=2030822 RepID=UPI0035167657